MLGSFREYTAYSNNISLLSLELGRPAMINDEDCDASLHNPVDDTLLRASETPASPSAPLLMSVHLPMIRVIRITSQLTRALKSPVIDSMTLQTYDTQFNDCMAAFPENQQIRTNDHIDPRYLPCLFYLQNARLVLHRHNLSVLGVAEARSVAIARCFTIAKDTVHLVSRCMQDPTDSTLLSPTGHQKWDPQLLSETSAFFCTHIWRCTLVLCFEGHYDAALVCVRASQAVGDTRPINVACGRHLAFFLTSLVSKMYHRDGHALEDEEDLIAYVSGDLQGSIENSWIWGKDEVDSQRSQHQQGSIPGIDHIGKGGTLENRQEDLSDWNGWDSIVLTLQRLYQDQQRGQREPFYLPPPGIPANAQISPVSSSRISIANII